MRTGVLGPQSGGGEVRLSGQRRSLLDLSPERPLGAHCSPAPSTAAQSGHWMRRNLPRSAAEPPPRPAQAPEPGHLRARARALQQLGSPALAELAAPRRAPQPGCVTPPGRGGGTRAAPRPPATHTHPGPALTGSDSAAASAFPRGSMALPDPPGPPPRRTAPPRKWTPAAGLCQPSPPPARGTGRSPSGRRSARPSAPWAGAPGGSPRPGQGPARAAADPGAPTTAPRPRRHQADSGLRLHPLQGKQLRTCGRTTRLGVSRQSPVPRQGRAAEGFRAPDPDSTQQPNPAHWREADSEKVKCSFNVIKFSGRGLSTCATLAVRRGLDRFCARGIKEISRKKTLRFLP